MPIFRAKNGGYLKNETAPVRFQSSHLSADDRIHAVVMRHPAAVILKDHFVDLFDLPVGKISEQFARLPHLLLDVPVGRQFEE